MPYGDRRLYGVCCAEKGTFRFAVRARGRAGHASVPALADNALLKLAPVLERLGARPRRATTSPTSRARSCRALGERPGRTRRARSSACAAVEPRLAALVEPTLGVDVRADDHQRRREDQRDPGARRAARSTAACPPGMGAEATMARVREVLGDADGVEVEFIEEVVGNRSPIESPLMDAIRDWVGEHDPGAEVVPVVLPGVHRLALVPRRVPRLRRLRLLPAAPPDAVRDLAADPRRRRAHRRPRPRLRRRASSTSCRGGCWHDRYPKTSSASAGWRCATGCSSTARRTGPPPCATDARRGQGRVGPQAARARASTASRACAASCASARRSR